MTATLRELEIGKTATVKEVGGEGALRQHLLDMGIIPGADVTMIKLAPMGDPMEVGVHGYELTIRLADAQKILIDNVREESKKTFEEFINELGDSYDDKYFLYKLLNVVENQEAYDKFNFDDLDGILSIIKIKLRYNVDLKKEHINYEFNEDIKEVSYDPENVKHDYTISIIKNEQELAQVNIEDNITVSTYIKNHKQSK